MTIHLTPDEAHAAVANDYACDLAAWKEAAAMKLRDDTAGLNAAAIVLVLLPVIAIAVLFSVTLYLAL